MKPNVVPFVVLGLPVVVGMVVGVVEVVVVGVVFIVVVVVRVSSLLQKSSLQHVFETLSASAQNESLTQVIIKFSSVMSTTQD